MKAILACALVFCSACLGQKKPRPFADPAPPEVRKLDAIDAPEAVDYAELRFHGAPKPLAEGAVSEDPNAFLGPRTDSHSRETKLLRCWPAGGPKLVWEMRCGQGYASPVIAGGRLVYTHRVGDESHVDCLDAATGKRFWRHSWPCDYKGVYISDGGPRSTPVISDGRVYVHGVQGALYCFELTTGRVVWQRHLGKELAVREDFFGTVSSPVVHGDLLLQNTGAPDGPTVAAFDKNTGRMVWGCGRDWGPSCSSPVLADVHGRTRLFVLAGGESRPPTGGLMVIDPTTGGLDLAYPFRAKRYASVTASPPVVGPDWVFISSAYGVGSHLLALSEDGGHERLWKSRVGLQFSNAVYDGGRIYAIDGASDRTGAIVAWNPKTGEEVTRTPLHWEEELVIDGDKKRVVFSIGEGSLLAVDGAFLCLGDNGHLLWLSMSAKGAEVLARAWLFGANESWTPPVVNRGLLYVCQNKRARFGNQPPRLLCYDLRAP